MDTENTTCWYVMTHLEMNRFVEWIKTENARRLNAGEAIVELFYPHDFLKEGQGNMSHDLVNIVFLKTTKNDIDHLVSNQKDTPPRLRLRHYLDTNGEKATVNGKTMQEFLDACIKYRGGFEIMPPISSIEATDKVRIISGPFAGHEATVARVQLSRGAIQLDLAVELLTGVMNIRMCNVDKSKVTILTRESVGAIRTDFIEYTQNHLLSILEHRVKRVDDPQTNRLDADMLTRLYRYRNHEVKNEAARAHFLSLMLVCAHLCRYTKDEEQLREKLLATLSDINQRSESKAATDARAYLWIALYISTQNPAYRDALKQYVRDHQPKSQRLRRFVSLIRKGHKV